jgi:hypothetical protein
MVQTDSLQINVAGRMCSALWITKVTKPHSEYIILITLPPQQWLCEGASMLRYTYIACLIRTHICTLQTRRLTSICGRSHDSPATVKHGHLQLSSS